MADRRSTEWRNENNQATALANSQIAVQIGTGVFTNNCTVDRILLDYAMRPITLGIDQLANLAIWVGQQEPVSTAGDDNVGYLYWRWTILRAASAGGADQFVRGSADVRGARRARSDLDKVWLVMRAGAGGDVLFNVSTRLLCIQP